MKSDEEKIELREKKAVPKLKLNTDIVIDPNHKPVIKNMPQVPSMESLRS